jgi:hypothetical protein
MLTSTNSQVSEVSGVQANAGEGFADTSPANTRGIRGICTASIIPKDTDRPCYRVLDDPHQEGDAKYRAGVWYFGIKAGKGEAPPTLCSNGFAARFTLTR